MDSALQAFSRYFLFECHVNLFEVDDSDVGLLANNCCFHSHWVVAALVFVLAGEFSDTCQHNIDKFDIQGRGQESRKHIVGDLPLFFGLFTDFWLINFSPDLINVLVNQQFEKGLKKSDKCKNDSCCKGHNSGDHQEGIRSVVISLC